LTENLVYWVWLSMMQKITPGEKMKLLEHFITPDKIWHASKDEIAALPFSNQKIFTQLADESIRRNSERAAKELESMDISAVSIYDQDYPALLKNIYDPPMVLYIRGNLVRDELMVAIVGSRRATPYGADISETLAYGLAKRNVTVISGMARGIDSCSHRGALEAGGRTVAILGCGVDVVYPPENKRLKKMIERSGAVISEYPPGTKPLPVNFIARNRIISGASAGTVVVEAGSRSGSLITAGYALEQGREVFAVPGNIDSPGSKGTNRLIRDGAKIVTCVDDILEEIGLSFPGKEDNGRQETRTKFHASLDENERAVVEMLEKGVSHIDRISRETGIAIKELEPLLLLLEMKGIIQQSPGRIYKMRKLSL
jgi:DNA processing protein